MQGPPLARTPRRHLFGRNLNDAAMSLPKCSSSLTVERIWQLSSTSRRTSPQRDITASLDESRISPRFQAS
jgi:hypothetical protein